MVEAVRIVDFVFDLLPGVLIEELYWRRGILLIRPNHLNALDTVAGRKVLCATFEQIIPPPCVHSAGKTSPTTQQG